MNAIRRLKQTGATRPQIAKACGVTRQAVGFWEHGVRVPQGKNYSALLDFAAAKGIVLLASDFGLQRKRRPQKAA